MGRFAYLRPSRDVTLQHTCSSGSSGYAMMREEEPDYDSTYISQSVSGSNRETKTSTFTLSGSVPSLKYGVVSKATLVVVAYRSTNGTFSGTISCDSSSGNLELKSNDWATTEIDLAASNYECGKSYSKNISIATTVSASNKGSSEVRITQAYIKLYYDAEYTLTTEYKGHGGNVITPISCSWEEWAGPIIHVDTDRHLLRLLMDSTDVTDEIKYIVPGGTYTVDSVSGATYGFKLNSNNYYESQNKAKSNSAALCKVTFHCNGNCTANVYVINYAEATYDFGILSETEETLGTSSTVDSKYKWIGNTSDKNKATEQLITYDLSDGEDFIYIKYRKDSATDSNNDSLQFRIEIIPSETNPYYTYTIEGVDDDHLFTAYFELPSVKVDNDWKEMKRIYKKINDNWVESIDYDTVFDEDTLYTYQILN